MTRVLLTYREYAALPDDGRRYEIHDGEQAREDSEARAVEAYARTSARPGLSRAPVSRGGPRTRPRSSETR